MTSEFISPPQISVNDYQRFVVDSRFAQKGESWRSQTADYLVGEQLEFLTQHGHGFFLIMSDEMTEAMGFDRSQAPDELRYGMADEMGDSLWFIFDAAEALGVSVPEAVATALKAHVPDTDAKVTSFADIESLALEHAREIEVLSKGNILGFLKDKPSLKRSPDVVFHRFVARFSRALDKQKFDGVGGPVTAAMLDAIPEFDQAIGDMMLAFAYIAKDRLGIPFEEVARFNMKKLQHRKIHGKENDIHFGIEA
ncbi:MAG: hypothetical protein JWM52_203 [Candidatus Saccharibacteria bacterium]|nr:hypothetical protein [Candidatus Saccharibacteria bacterium]